MIDYNGVAYVAMAFNCRLPGHYLFFLFSKIFLCCSTQTEIAYFALSLIKILRSNHRLSLGARCLRDEHNARSSMESVWRLLTANGRNFNRSRGACANIELKSEQNCQMQIEMHGDAQPMRHGSIHCPQPNKLFSILG